MLWRYFYEGSMSWTPSEMGKKGGAVKGASKIRGTSEYYKAIRAKRTEKLKAGALHYSLQQTHGGQSVDK